MGKKIRPVSEEDTITAEIVNSNSSSSIQRENLEKYSQLEETNKSLLKENSELQNRIAEYIAELRDAKKDKNENSANSVNKQLEQKCKDLQEASDEYLMKISELSFENAKLKAEIQELSKRITTNVEIPSKTKLIHPAYNPYKTNGYSSWN